MTHQEQIQALILERANLIQNFIKENNLINDTKGRQTAAAATRPRDAEIREQLNILSQQQDEVEIPQVFDPEEKPQIRQDQKINPLIPILVIGGLLVFG